MSGKGHFEVAEQATRRAFLAGLGAVILAAPGLCAAVGDLAPEDRPEPGVELKASAQRKADALAWFMTGLFEEESEGPEKAMESKRKALALDPGNSPLAIEISYDYLRRGETAEAIAVLKDAAKANPKDPMASLALSSVYLRQLRKPDLALKYAQSALDAAPDSFLPYDAMWEIHSSQGQTSKARAVFDRAARSDSKDPRFWLSLAASLARNLARENNSSVLDDEQARRITRFLEKAGANAGSDPEVLTQIGDLYFLARQPEMALPFYKKVVDTKASYPLSRDKLAACYFETGRTADAIKVLEEAVKLNALNVNAYDLLAKAFVKEGDLEKALASARQALLVEPTKIERHRQVANLLFYGLNRFDEAAEVLAAGRQRFPRTADLTLLHARALSQIKRHDEAMKTFEIALVEASNSHPEAIDADFFFLYGAAAEQAGQYVKAAELFRKSIALDPDNSAQACNYLGYMWVDRDENLDEAEQLIRRALQADPNNGAYIDSLGWLHYKQGKYQEALKELLRAAEALAAEPRAEPDAVVFDHIGDAYDKLGKKAEAVLYWQKSLKIDPDSKPVAAKLDKASEKVAQKPQEKSVSPQAAP